MTKSAAKGSPSVRKRSRPSKSAALCSLQKAHTPRALPENGARPRRTSAEMAALGDDVRTGRKTADLQGPFDVDVLCDPVDDRINRELANEIRKLVRRYKAQDGKQTFVIGWRLYPNAEHPRFKRDENTCGCGCGCGG